VTPIDSLSTNWWYHVPNLVMAAMIYTLIGRYVLDMLFGNRDVVMLKVFRQITDPILKAVRAITPAIVPNGVLIVFAILWLMAGRMAWFLLAVMFGMRLA
jgi:uncharacterized protein YggT (Ycf19 family)